MNVRCAVAFCGRGTGGRPRGGCCTRAAATCDPPGVAPRDDVLLLPLLALALAVGAFVSLTASLDALVLHRVAWPVIALAFLIGAGTLAGVLRAAGRALSILRRTRVTGRRTATSTRLQGHDDVLLVDDPAPTAWCLGLLAPRVAVSVGAVHALTPEALAAVLAHERHHARRRDNLRQATVEVLAAALFLETTLDQAGRRHRTALELAADRAAACTPGGASALARALLAFEDAGRGVEPARADRLLGDTRPLALGRRTLAVVTGLLVVLATAGLTCTLATGCLDIFLLREDDATAARVGLLPPLFVVAALLARTAPALAFPRRWR